MTKMINVARFVLAIKACSVAETIIDFVRIVEKVNTKEKTMHNNIKIPKPPN